tara:strand:+ start:26650 stop:26964 length:315 start_codon:yes stop_codon:yes gene_type:complete
MNLKQAIEITKENPDLNIFIPMKYDLGLMVREAKSETASVSASILKKAPFLDVKGYEACVHQLSNGKHRKTKGKIRGDIPDAPRTWATWGVAESDLQANNYMVI